MKAKTAFEIVLDRLADAQSDNEKLRGERDIARAEVSAATHRALHSDMTAVRMREITDYTSSDSFHRLLLDIRAVLCGDEAQPPELLQRVFAAIESTMPPSPPHPKDR